MTIIQKDNCLKCLSHCVSLSPLGLPQEHQRGFLAGINFLEKPRALLPVPCHGCLTLHIISWGSLKLCYRGVSRLPNPSSSGGLSAPLNSRILLCTGGEPQKASENKGRHFGADSGPAHNRQPTIYRCVSCEPTVRLAIRILWFLFLIVKSKVKKQTGRR